MFQKNTVATVIFNLITADNNVAHVAIIIFRATLLACLQKNALRFAIPQNIIFDNHARRTLMQGNMGTVLSKIFILMYFNGILYTFNTLEIRTISITPIRSIG